LIVCPWLVRGTLPLSTARSARDREALRILPVARQEITAATPMQANRLRACWPGRH